MDASVAEIHSQAVFNVRVCVLLLFFCTTHNLNDTTWRTDHQFQNLLDANLTPPGYKVSLTACGFVHIITAKVISNVSAIPIFRQQLLCTHMFFFSCILPPAVVIFIKNGLPAAPHIYTFALGFEGGEVLHWTPPETLGGKVLTDVKRGSQYWWLGSSISAIWRLQENKYEGHKWIRGSRLKVLLSSSPAAKRKRETAKGRVLVAKNAGRHHPYQKKKKKTGLTSLGW